MALVTAATLVPVVRATAQGPDKPVASSHFGFDEVVERARLLAAMPFDTEIKSAPDAVANLNYDAYRDIRFRPDRALLDGAFRMHLFHLGFLFKRPVAINLVREGVSQALPYDASLFDYGQNQFDPPLPEDLGFAGLRLHYPLNDPKVADELIVFQGASYFRFLGRGQRYGLSARGIAVGSGDAGEEFPGFDEFWVEDPAPGATKIVIYALLNGPSITGAYRFTVYPQDETVVNVTTTLFPRRAIERLGLAPLTSMFFVSTNDRRFEDFRPEVHDSDGLLLHTGTEEWIWRPLRNPAKVHVSSFEDSNPKGFGLIQRSRDFRRFEDLEARYDLRPSYWIKFEGDWGKGRVDLVELPAEDETGDNVVAFWVPAEPVEAGRAISRSYSITAMSDGATLHTGGKTRNTFQTAPAAHGSKESPKPGNRRFLIDFAGGDLDYFLKAPEQVELVPSAVGASITSTFLVPNPEEHGFRAGLDLVAPVGTTVDLRAYLRAGDRALTETWTFQWTSF